MIRPLFNFQDWFSQDRRYLELEAELFARVLQTAPELAQIGALIYLILKLEERRFAAIKARDEAYRHVLDALIGLLDELISVQNPDKLSAKQVEYVQQWVKKMVPKDPPKFDKSQ